jgi:hypothetical protein
MTRLARILRKLDEIVPPILIVGIMVVSWFRGPLGLSDSRVFNSYVSFWGALFYACLAAGAARLILYPLRRLAEKLAKIEPPKE